MPSTGESRSDIRKKLAQEALPSGQTRSSTTTLPDPRAEQIRKMQGAFERQSLNDAPPEQRERISANSRASQDLLSQYELVGEKIRTLGPNADPATLQQLHAQADLLSKQSAAILLHANTERTIAGIERRQEQLSQRVEKLQEEIKELGKLNEKDPRRLAGVLDVKRDQLQAIQETRAALATMKSSLSNSLTTSDSFISRAGELGKEQPISTTHLAEARANVDSALLVLEDADGKTSLYAIDTGLKRLDEAHRQDLERRSMFAAGIARFDAQEQQLRDASKASSGRAQSTIRQAFETTDDITKATSSWNPFQGLANLVTGTTSAMKSSRDNLLTEAGEQNTATSHLLEERKSVQRAREEYIKSTHAGFEAERQGVAHKAQALFNQAELIKQATFELGNPEAIKQVLMQPSKNWQQRNHDVARQLNAAVASAKKWEAGLEVARNVTVVAGATVATVATAGAGAGLFLSFAAGSGGGIAIGSLSNTTEQVTSVATGVKTGEQAQTDFKRRFQQDAILSLQTAATTVPGVAAGRAFQASSLASKLSTTVARPLSGAIGGGTSGTTTTAIDTAQTLYRRNEAIAEFNRSPDVQGQSPAERQKALDVRLSELGLGLDDLAKRGVVNIGIGVFGGSVGATTGAMRETAKTSLAKVSTIVLDTGADLALGLGATLLTDGKISFEQALAQSLQSVFLGNALSSLPARRTGLVETSAQPAKTKVNYLEDAESLQARFVSDSIDQLTASNGRPPTPDEIARINAESKFVRGYENPHTGEINVLKIDTDSMSRAERVRYASDIVHELAHRRGGDEVAAHKAQFEYLLKNGYQPEIVDGQLRIRALESGASGTLPSVAQIRGYVARNYDSEESLGRMRLSKYEEARRTDSDRGQNPGTAAHHNPDVGMPQKKDIQSFLESEMKRHRTFGDRNLDAFSSNEVADYMVTQLAPLGELAPEAMLLLRSEKRMGTKIADIPLGKLLEEPALIHDAIFEARKIYTDNTNGPTHPIPSSYPRTAQAAHSLNELFTTVSQDLGIGPVTISERRGRFTGLVVESARPDILLRYDNPHTLNRGVPISPERARLGHGPGGDMPHIDVELPDRSQIKYFKGEDGVVYKCENSKDPEKRNFYRQIDGRDGKEWQQIRDPKSYSYRLETP